MRPQVSQRSFVWNTLILLLLSAVALLAASCGEPKPVTIGVLLPETGPAAPYGRTIRQGVELAVDRLNAAGGVSGGHLLRAEFRDTKTNGNQAQVAFQQLLDQQVPAIIGPGTSTVALSLVPQIDKAQIIVISPSASSPRLSDDGGKWFYRVYPSDVVEGFRMASFCREMLWTKVAVIASDDTFGQDIAAVFTDHYEAGVREVVYREDIPELLSPEQIKKIVSQVKKSKPDAVYLAAYVDQTAQLLRALDELKDKPVMLGTSAVTREIVQKAGSAAEGFVFPQVYFDCASTDPDVCTFIDEYRKRFGEDPDTYAAHAYDAVEVLAHAMEETSVLTADEIVVTLSHIDHNGVTGKIQFNQNGDVVRPPRVFAVLGGEIVSFEKFKETRAAQQSLSK